MDQTRARRRARLADVASRCSVSISTVSRALSSDKGVRADVRDRVLEAARAVGYPIAPAPGGARTVLVAASGDAMIDYSRNQFTLHVLEGLRDRAAELDVPIETRPASTEADLAALLDDAARPDVGGVLLLTLDEERVLSSVRDFTKPVVLVNGDDPLMRLSSVAPCNRAAAAVATGHLRALGHERILFLARRGRRTIERRLEGWRDAMPAGAPLDDLILAVDDWLPAPAEAALRRRIEARGLDFSAVLAAGDTLALGALRALGACGIDVPGTVSVVGMDDLPQAAFAAPPLTTVHIPMRAIGAAALDLLREAAAGALVPPRRVELACRLVERQSTAPRP